MERIIMKTFKYYYGTREGSRKAAATTKDKHGNDFYKMIGKKGGSVLGTRGGFACPYKGKDGLTGPERSKIYGAIGGRKSKRGPAK